MLKFGDHVVLVQKVRTGVDGATDICRVHAIVLASMEHKPVGADRRLIEGSEPEEHIVAAYPEPALVKLKGAVRYRGLEQVLKVAHSVPVWREGAWIGYEAGEEESLRAQLAVICAANESLKEQLTANRPIVLEGLVNSGEGAGLPSADDLDSAAEESATAENTSGE